MSRFTGDPPTPIVIIPLTASGKNGDRRSPQFGFAKELLAGLDVDALLAVDISGEFAESGSGQYEIDC